MWNELLLSFSQNFWEKVEKSLIYYRIVMIHVTPKPYSWEHNLSPNMGNISFNNTHWFILNFVTQILCLPNNLFQYLKAFFLLLYSFLESWSILITQQLLFGDGHKVQMYTSFRNAITKYIEYLWTCYDMEINKQLV